MLDREKLIKHFEHLLNAAKGNYQDFVDLTVDENGKITPLPIVFPNCPLKEQEAIEWINAKDKLPEKDGQYLVVYTFFDYKGMGVVRFSHNLHEVDEYVFDEENRPGWYEPDDEVGYFERTTVTHWAKLPEFPKEGR